jgi:hypothetical protein
VYVCVCVCACVCVCGMHICAPACPSFRPPDIGPDGRTVFDHRLSYRRSDSPENFNQRETFIVEMSKSGGGGDDDDGDDADIHRNPSAEYLMAFDSQMQSAIAAMDNTLQKQQSSGGTDDDVPFVRTRPKSPQVRGHTAQSCGLSLLLPACLLHCVCSR